MNSKEVHNVLDNLIKSAESNMCDENVKLSPLIPEMDLISDQGIVSFVRAVLMHAPDNFWTMPSTLSDINEHPPDELTKGGNVLHTKRVARVVYDLANSQSIDPKDVDYLVAAALLHDVTKGGFGEEPEHDDLHPYTVDLLVDMIRGIESTKANEAESNTIWTDSGDIEAILRIIRCHAGLFSPIPETIPVSTLEWILHFANVMASNLHRYLDPGGSINEWRWTEPKGDGPS